jgi:hypothetical protein
MGKRQIIYNSQQIAGNSELLDKEINLITKELRVWHGRVIAVNQDNLELKDARSGKHTFAIGQIDKIYREIVTDY